MPKTSQKNPQQGVVAYLTDWKRAIREKIYSCCWLVGKNVFMKNDYIVVDYKHVCDWQQQQQSTVKATSSRILLGSARINDPSFLVGPYQTTHNLFSTSAAAAADSLLLLRNQITSIVLYEYLKNAPMASLLSSWLPCASGTTTIVLHSFFFPLRTLLLPANTSIFEW